MRIENHSSAPNRQADSSRIQWLLRLYPRAWRERYGDEVASVLAEHRVTAWTALDLLLGALDAHLHRHLLPERLISMTHRMRSSEIVVFCAFALFCVAWLPLRLVRDPLPIWRSAVAAHPELLTALTVLDAAGSVAALGHAVAARRWGVLALFVIPVLAAAALIVCWIVAIPASTERQMNTPDAPFTPLAIALQFGLVILLLLAIGGSVAAVAAAIGRSELSERLLRFALIPAGVATVALALGLVGAVALTALIFAEAPQVSSSPPVHIVILLVIVAAVALALAALRRGIEAARGGVSAA
jgi:hypothetical protein